MGGQFLLLTAGLAILSLLMLTFNKFQSSQLTTSLSYESIVTSSALAQGLMDEICTRSFDEKTVSKGVTSANSLTPVDSLGPNPGESSPIQFDDIDDYNNYNRTESLPRLGSFNLKVKVRYIQTMVPNVYIANRSFSKQIDITVSTPFLRETLDPQDPRYLRDSLNIHNIISY